jgi:phospholipid/cholesterol/gamma-HCH transport system permease protein
MILEFSNAVVALILAGKVGSNIASEIGTMRVTEQVDALEIMGVNSASYLILPKIVASLLIAPFLNIIGIFVGIFGGYLAAVFTDALTPYEYTYGIHAYFIPFYVTYSVIKMVFFAFIITTISAYHGYYTRGGALEVGKSSTRAVVYSSILILVADVILTQILLA